MSKFEGIVGVSQLIFALAFQTSKVESLVDLGMFENCAFHLKLFTKEIKYFDLTEEIIQNNPGVKRTIYDLNHMKTLPDWNSLGNGNNTSRNVNHILEKCAVNLLIRGEMGKNEFHLSLTEFISANDYFFLTPRTHSTFIVIQDSQQRLRITRDFMQRSVRIFFFMIKPLKSDSELFYFCPYCTKHLVKISDRISLGNLNTEYYARGWNNM